MDPQITSFKKWLILFNAALSTFMATLDGSIVNIALPILTKELNASISSIQWVVTSYLLTISVLLLVWGKLSDIYGRKYIFAFGFLTFTLGSALCGFSGSLPLLIFSRIIQAIGASAMMGLSQGIVIRAFPPKERGKALGIVGTTVAIGSLVGPSLGGYLLELSGWKTIFLINIPIGLFGTLLTFLIIPKMHEAPENKSFDFKGSLLFGFSVLILFVGLLMVQDGLIPVIFFVPLIVLSSVTFYFLIQFEKTVKNPLINLSLFKIHEFSFGLGSGFLSFAAISTSLFFIPFYMQNVLTLSALQAGLLISFYPISAAITAPISGWLSDKITYRPLTIIGLSISTLVSVGIANLNATSSHVLIAVYMVLLGIGLAIFQSPNNSSVMGSVPSNQVGIAGSLNALCRNLGMVSGTTFSALLFSRITQTHVGSLSPSALIGRELFLKGYKAVILFAATACFLSLLISLTRAAKIKPTIHQ